MENEIKVPVRSTMREMEVGDKYVYPIVKMSVVRSTASILGVELDRKYKVVQDRDERIVEVERVR